MCVTNFVKTLNLREIKFIFFFRLDDEAKLAADARACTGVLAIHPMSRDIKISNFSVTFHGVELLLDTKLELSVGQR